MKTPSDEKLWKNFILQFAELPYNLRPGFRNVNLLTLFGMRPDSG